MSNILHPILLDHYRPGDEQSILALNQLEYGNTHVMVNPEDFDWRYRQNPAGQTDICVVRDQVTQQVVGFNWIVPLSMRLYGKNQQGALTANLLIHPDYRDSIAYVKLTRRKLQRLRQRGSAFRFSFPADKIFERSRAIEKTTTFDIPLLIRPINIKALSGIYFAHPALQLLAGWGGKITTPLFFKAAPPPRQPTELTVTWLDRFDDRFDNLWQRVQDKYKIMVVRDQAFLTWRFASVSERNYKILAATANGQLVGYAVLRCTDEIRDIPVGLIMDFLLEPGQRGDFAGQLLMTKAWHYFREQRVWLAGGLAFPHTAEYQIMHKAGYRPTPAKCAPRFFRVAFNCFDADLPSTTQVSPDHWFLTIADYEAH